MALETGASKSIEALFFRKFLEQNHGQVTSCFGARVFVGSSPAGRLRWPPKQTEANRPTPWECMEIQSWIEKKSEKKQLNKEQPERNQRLKGGTKKRAS